MDVFSQRRPVRHQWSIKMQSRDWENESKSKWHGSNNNKENYGVA
jgi:hypothetical protein